ncbi:hypothetical protein CTY74_07185 [Acinetobacter baumannii]|uniref:Uncharacterized protein n=2 Tax=Acinetobacter baumannii TaxID=470 RepID=A0A0C4Y2N5_ACIBA|nr:hypothetical protein ABTJ_p0063 [Acinetobacter baumannii MDR-TJ]AJF79911.1 hypothetical protein NG19_0075 [Acinetobacter baumannii]APF45764.1 hypothetical protein BKJ37_19725 [Acinetobacter baumannii]APM50925.1 hypothetical protein BS615_19595 [Acinetobacter baumannii]KPA48977.1 hypothetical protein AC795_09630 [Acinetobacter baumannii]
MDYFKLSTPSIILLILSLCMIIPGLYWIYSKKYRSDLWVRETGKNIFYIGIFFFLNVIVFSIDLPKLKTKNECSKDIQYSKSCPK